MNILIFTNEEVKTTLSIKIRGGYDTEPGARVEERQIRPLVNNRVGEKVKELFEEIGKLVGNPSFTQQFTLSFE